MERLIPILNQLQNVLGVLGNHSISLPQLVVVGSQSSGKSSVLENIVGRDFLPRGNNIVTRRPLVLQLYNIPQKPGTSPSQTTPIDTADSASISPLLSSLSAGDHIKDNAAAPVSSHVGGQGVGGPAPENNNHDDSQTPPPTQPPNYNTPHDTNVSSCEWGEFDHIQGKFTDFNQIKQEIIAETERLIGKGTAISSTPIYLRIYSPFIPSLTLVDLPGITKVATGDQPKDIERQIRNLVLKFITNPNSIIVAVTSATEDIANSEALKIAREVDPLGHRTLGVITKLDLMDPGTDALLTLQNKTIPLKLGYIGVVNRGQRDILENKTIREALQHERVFFESSVYNPISHLCGTDYLTKRLSALLLHSLQIHLPHIKQQIILTIQDTEKELESYGHPLGIDLFPTFDKDGNRNFNNLTAAIPEAHLGPALLELMSKFATNYIDSLDGRSMGSFSEITTNQLYGGARIAFVFQDIFGAEVDAIDPFDHLSDHEIRTAIRNATGPRPFLFLPEIAFEILVKQQIERLRVPAITCVDLILDELLRVAFQCQSSSMPHLNRFPKLKESLMDCVRNLLHQRISPTKQMVANIINIELAYINTSHPDFIGGNRALTQLALARKQKKQQENGNGDFHEDNQHQHDVHHSQQHPMPMDVAPYGSFTSEAIRTLSTQPPSERELMEIEVIKLLIASYYGIVKKTIKDTVPKAIMLMLVNKTKSDIQSELVRELYHEDQFSPLLKEADDISEKRSSCVQLIVLMRKALDIVSRLKDTTII